MSHETVREVESILAADEWIVRIPSELADGLEVRRFQSFKRLLGPGAPVVIVLTIALAMTGPIMFSVPVLSHDGRLWWAVESVTLAILVAGTALVHLPPVLAHYSEVLTFASWIILGLKLFLTVELADPGLARFESYVCMLITSMVATGFRLSLPRALLACVGAGIVAAVAIVISGARVDPTQLPVFALGSTGVSLGIAFFGDRQERLNFLQSVLLLHESSERAELNEKLERIARTDPLTGLSNRRHFDERLRLEWERSVRSNEPISLLFVDVDHFKAFNDTFGHLAGDSCLARVASALESVPKRPADLVARYGGEEIVVLLPNTGVEGARIVATLLLAAVDRLAIPTMPSRFPGHVTVSIGLASIHAVEGVDESVLTQAADDAVYRAKRAGRNCIVAASDPFEERVAIRA